MSLKGLSPRHYIWVTQVFSKKCCIGGKPLATLCPIRPARDWNLRPPALETNAFQSTNWLVASVSNWKQVCPVVQHCVQLARDWNLRLPALKNNALPLDQLAGSKVHKSYKAAGFVKFTFFLFVSIFKHFTTKALFYINLMLHEPLKLR